MHELACPNCNSTSQYDFDEILLMCPYCSATFRINYENGQKDIFPDHYIVPNMSDPGQIKGIVLEWLRRMHHKPTAVDKEYFVTDIAGYSIPYWVISMEAHTSWKGLVKRAHRNRLESQLGGDFLLESGHFRRTYRWAVSARKNVCEVWGMTRLHEPKEALQTEWDGFPLDSTYSRGRLIDKPGLGDRTAYDLREYFDFKLANNLPVLGVEIEEEEALRRARHHVNLYHYQLSKLNADFLTDYRTELEIAGVQLIHLPFWHARYVYQPKTALRHIYKPKEKNVVIEGFSSGILVGELALQRQDKLWINTAVCGSAAITFFILGILWHPAFFLVSLFAVAITAVSIFNAGGKATSEAGNFIKAEAESH